MWILDNNFAAFPFFALNFPWKKFQTFQLGISRSIFILQKIKVYKNVSTRSRLSLLVIKWVIGVVFLEATLWTDFEEAVIHLITFVGNYVHCSQMLTLDKLLSVNSRVTRVEKYIFIKNEPLNWLTKNNINCEIREWKINVSLCYFWFALVIEYTKNDRWNVNRLFRD